MDSTREGTMTSRAKTGNTTTGRRPRRVAPLRPVATDEHARFRDLAYRLVHCTDAVEEQRLKAELVRSVLRRREKGTCVTAD
jgi:hypothetical protein